MSLITIIIIVSAFSNEAASTKIDLPKRFLLSLWKGIF